jgi:hypothetical protein
MSALLQQPLFGTATHDLLIVEREGIRFHNVDPRRVEIEITVRNIGDEVSPATDALISAAPLGAFVTWRPLAMLPVRALEPGETEVLRLEVERRFPQVLGTPPRIPPRSLLTALAQDDEQPQNSPAGLSKPTGGRTLSLLPFDINDVFDRTNIHWAGNLNIFIGGKSVERHLAQALRIYPGKINMAFFVVGSGPDAYSFEITGVGAGWDTKLYSPRELSVDGPAINQGEWIVTRSREMMLLKMCPPKGCQTGTLEVHVCQRSTGARAMVEFSFDPAAAGPGCYVV